MSAVGGDEKTPSAKEEDSDPKDIPTIDNTDITDRLRKNPPMTAIGKENMVNTLKGQIKSISKRLGRQLSLLTPLLLSTNATTIDNETHLNKIYNEITDTHGRLCETLNSDEDG